MARGDAGGRRGAVFHREMKGSNMKQIHTEQAHAALGPYSQAIVAGGMVYVSGQLAIVPETGELVQGTITEQTARIAQNLSAILEEAGSGLANVVKSTCFMADLADFAEFNAEYAKHFTSNPARECVQVAALPKAAQLEVSVIATLNEE